MNEYEVLERLQEAGVVFLVKVPDRGKIVKVEASPFDLIEFAADNSRFYAKCHCVTKETYLSWVADQYSVQCAHLASKLVRSARSTFQVASQFQPANTWNCKA